MARRSTGREGGENLKSDKVTSQMRIPEAVYRALRHVAAERCQSINQTVIDLLMQALEAHHSSLPTALSEALGVQPKDD